MNSQGSASVSGNTLILVPSQRMLTGKDTCNGAANYRKQGSRTTESFRWAVDQYQIGAKLCLQERTPTAATEPTCAYLRDAKPPTEATAVNTGSGARRGNKFARGQQMTSAA